jgi:predicted RNA-binding protein with PUA-like domain
MGHWLFKQEPRCYSFSDLERDQTTLWDGVSNSLALQNLRKVCRGDQILFYHTGKEKAIVGVMRAESRPKPDPDRDDRKAVVVQVRVVRRLHGPVSLGRIKRDPQLKNWDLVRLPRLSVLPVTEEQWRRVEDLSREAGCP